MSNKNHVLAEIEEEILSCEASDEALETAAAATPAKAAPMSFSFCTSVYTCPWW